jgi:uncharacterized membrane protein YdjX (TVP38/TMEM64 family)
MAAATPEDGRARSGWFSRLVAGVYVVSLALMAIGSWPYVTRLSDPAFQQEIAAWAGQAGWRGWGLVIGLEIMQVVVAPVPGGPVQVLAGVLYGVWGGLLACLAGCAVASCISFRVAGKFGAALVNVMLGEARLARYGFLKDSRRLEMVLFLLFLVPGTPKDLLIWFAGVMPVSMGRFVFWTTLARIPGILASTALGASAQAGEWAAAALVLTVAVIAGFLGVRGKNAVLARSRKPGGRVP